MIKGQSLTSITGQEGWFSLQTSHVGKGPAVLALCSWGCHSCRSTVTLGQRPPCPAPGISSAFCHQLQALSLLLGCASCRRMRENPCALLGGLREARTKATAPASAFLLLPCLCSWIVVGWAPVDTPALTVSSLAQEAAHRFALPASSSGGAVKQENFVLGTSGYVFMAMLVSVPGASLCSLSVCGKGLHSSPGVT